MADSAAAARDARMQRIADDAARDRMKRRQFASEVERLKERQGGITPRHQVILEGVYELEPKPDFRTEARLASQLALTPLAVTTWFRVRRVKAKRSRMRTVGTVMLSLIFVCLGLYYSYELSGLDALMNLRRATNPANRRFFTKSGLPRPFKAKAATEPRFQQPKKSISKAPTTGTPGGAASTTGTTKAGGSTTTGTSTTGIYASLFGSATQKGAGALRRPTKQAEAASFSRSSEGDSSRRREM